MRLGVYGGSFDPPHNAHVALAQAAVSQLGLDMLRVFPTGNAWHKPRELSAAQQRIAMARIAFAHVAKSVVDDRETRRAGPTYTIDTLRELQVEHPGAELFLVMGEDQLQAFTSWRQWEEIARIATLCVARRPVRLSGTEPESRTDGGPRPRIESAVTALDHATMVELELPDMPENATDIRRKAARGEDISSLVPPGVAGYIASQHLYTQGH